MIKVRKSLLLMLCLSMILSTIFAVPVSAAGKKKSKTIGKGTSVWFGNYEQNNIDDGPEPIEWIVVEDNGDTLLLMSKYILVGDYYGKNSEDYSWKNSRVREYCNQDFYKKAFTKEERKEIKKVKVSDIYGTTKDKIFIFSEKELEKYFPKESQRTALVTNYANNNGCSGVSNYFIKLYPEFKKFHGNGQWLVRGPFLNNGKELLGISDITLKGWFSYGEDPIAMKNGIRPVMYVNKGAVSFEDPYVKNEKDPSLNVFKNVDKKKKKEKEKYIAPDKLKLSGNKEDIIVTKNYSYIETDNYVVFLDKDISVRGNLREDIDKVFKRIEETVGFSFQPTDSFWLDKNGRHSSLSIRLLYFGGNHWKGINEDGKKFSIYVFKNKSDEEACALGNEIILKDLDIDFYGSSLGTSTITHELLHSVQYINSVYLKETGDKLCEGYAAYNEIKILSSWEATPVDPEYLEVYETNVDLEINAMNSEKELLKNYTEIYGQRNFEEYQLGYALVKFMNEEYLEIPFNTFLKKLGDYFIKTKKSRLTVEMERKVIKQVYGDDFFTKFGDWFEKKYN